MKNIDALRQYEIEIGVMSDLANKPTTFESQSWLTQGYLKFVKTRFSGMNAKTLAFEQDTKRSIDLIKLLKIVSIPVTKSGALEYHVVYPTDCFLPLGEDVIISTYEDPVDVFECTVENFTSKYNNSLTDVHGFYGYARPARLLTDTGAKLKTDKDYEIKTYTLYYLKTPSLINVLDQPNDEFTELTEATQSEVIKLAASMYLENKANPRYKTHLNEIASME